MLQIYCGEPYNSDSTIFWTVGRGITNGLVPYRDLFETKPPGIFLVSALSFWLTHGTFIAHVLQSLIIALLPVTILLPVILHRRGDRSEHKWIVTISTLFALCIGLYTAQAAGTFNPASFGVFFACAYVMVIVWNQEAFSLPRILAASVCILLAIGFKEPFIYPILCAALLFSDSVSAFIRMFVIPVGLAIVEGAAALFSLGYLSAYASIYVPFMRNSYTDRVLPDWLKGFMVHRVFLDYWSFSPLFAIAVILLIVLAVSLAWWHGKGVKAGIIVLSIYCVTYASGLAGVYFSTHISVTVPFFVALFFFILMNIDVSRFSAGWSGRGVAAFVICLITTALFLPFRTYFPETTALAASYKQSLEQARELDAIMDKCGIRRYLLTTGVDNLYGFTRHSPLGPAFTFNNEFNFYPPFHKQYVENFKQAQLIVASPQGEQNTWYSGADIQYIGSQFTFTPWPCAGTGTVDGMVVLYRNK